MNPFTYALGPMLVSIFLNTYVAGLVGFQYAIYKSVTFQVSWWMKIAVSSLWTIDLFQIIITIYMTWIYFVTNYLDPTALRQVALWTFTVIPICNAASGIVAHIVMARRLYLASHKKRPITSALFLTIFVSFTLGFAVGVCGILWDLSIIDIVRGTKPTTSSYPYRRLLLSWFVTRLAVDAALTGSLSCLFKQQNNSDFLDTHPSLFVRYTLRAIQSGVLTTLFSFLCLVTFLCSRRTTAYVVFLLPSGRLYSNIVLTSINVHARRVNLNPQKTTQALTADIWAAHQTSNAQTFNITETRTADIFTDADTHISEEDRVNSNAVDKTAAASVSTVAGVPSTLTVDAKCSNCTS